MEAALVAGLELSPAPNGPAVPILLNVGAATVPALMVNGPVKVLAVLLSVRVPAPIFVRPPLMLATREPTVTLAPVPPPPVSVTVGATVYSPGLVMTMPSTAPPLIIA